MWVTMKLELQQGYVLVIFKNNCSSIAIKLLISLISLGKLQFWLQLKAGGNEEVSQHQLNAARNEEEVDLSKGLQTKLSSYITILIF